MKVESDVPFWNEISARGWLRLTWRHSKWPGESEFFENLTFRPFGTVLTYYFNINVTKCKQSEIKNRVPTRFNRFLKHHIANLTPEIDFLDNFTLVNYFSGSYWSKNNGMRASFWNRLSQAKMLVLAVEKKRSEWLAVQYNALRQRNQGFSMAIINWLR